MFNNVLNFNKDRSLNGQFPQMGEVLDSWEFPLTLIKIKQNIVEQESSIYNRLLPDFYPSPENLSFKQSFQHKSWLFPRLTGEG